MIKVVTACALLGLASVVILADSAAVARDETDQLRIVYMEPQTSAQEKTLQTLKSQQVLEKIRKMTSPIQLPRRLTVKVRSCDGQRNAYYDNDVITICYDYLDFIMENAAKAPDIVGIGAEAAWTGATLDLVLHEVAHAVFDMLRIPVLGREEDAADMFSAYLMLQFDPAEARNMIAGTAFLAITEAHEAQQKALSPKVYADEHGLPMQRYFNLLCIAYGKDPNTFADILSKAHFPEERSEGCAEDYRQIRYAFKTLIDPHIDQTLAKKVEVHF